MSEGIELVPSPAPAAAPGARHLVVICALLAAAERFAPVPFLDDVLRERIRQYLVSRTLRQSGRTYGSAAVGPLWRDEGGCASGCLALAWKIPLKLLLFPIRKIVSIVRAIHGFSRDVTESLLFGRALDRGLARGLLTEGTPPDALAVQATTLRRAFEEASRGVDLAFITGALADALRGVRGLPRAALRAARSLSKKDAEPPAPEAAASGSDREVVEQGAGAVERVLQRPDVVRVLADFDARFDAALGRGPTSSQ